MNITQPSRPVTHVTVPLVECVAGLTLLIVGTALFPYPMIGLAGLPLVFIGFPLCVHGTFALTRGENELGGYLVGSVLVVAGAAAILLVSAYTTTQVHAVILAARRGLPGNGIDLLLPVSWVAVAALSMAGIRVRNARPLVHASTIWLSLLMVGPFAVITTIVFSFVFAK